jgi:hypothetical protein
MNLYITFEEYTDLGGKITDDTIFTQKARRCQYLLDYITFNRIPLLPEVPECVKDAMVDFIDRVYEAELVNNAGGGEVSSYSNTVEKITYKTSTESDKLTELMKTVAYRYLPDYLLARSISYDVEQYLQSESNNS